MGLVNIRGTVVLPDGSVAARRDIIIRHAHRHAEEQPGFVVAKDDVLITTDDLGRVNFSLYDGPYVALYDDDFNTGKFFKFFVPDVEGDVNFSNLIPQYVGPNPTSVYRTKVGDTIKFGCMYLDDNGVPKSLSGINIKASMEHEKSGHRVDFAVGVGDKSNGEFELVVSSGRAESFQVGIYVFDIEFNDRTHAKHTSTGKIEVVRSIA